MKKLLSVLALIFAITFTTEAYALSPKTADGSATIKVTSDNYELLTEKHKLLVVDFWATWCGPCLAIGPHLEALAKEYKGVVAVGKCDVDENRQFAKSFGISSIPAIFFIKSGKIVDMQIGYCNKEELKKKFEKLRK